MSSEFHNLEELEDRFDQMAKAAERLEVPEAVPFDELFDASFMSAHSNFTSFDEFLSAGGYHPSTSTELEATLGTEFNEFINRMTDFPSWEEMFREASIHYFASSLSF